MENKKNCFPYGYGDRIREDEVRLSDYVVITAKNKKVQEYTKYTMALAAALFALGSYAGPAKAIPPEYGEAANQFAA